VAAGKRITLVTDELLGYVRTGGIGTATTFLALALGRLGHQVELRYSADPPDVQLAQEWAHLYEKAGVRIRMLPRSDTPVEPSYFGRMRDVELALAADPPDVVITQDLAAPAYAAIRMRALGLAFADTLFVVYCHGTRQWITDAARKVRVLPGALGITMLEQASIELADVVISPSHYLVDWMQQQRWRLPPDTRVIPHLTRSVATGEAQSRTEAHLGRVQRLAFFGRLEERKGIRPFIEALNALPAELVSGIEIEFIGRPTPTWTPERVKALLSERVKVSFQTNLDQPEALARLARPGTLAVMPSFEETFGNTVRECLDYGIPFVASTAAAIQELVALEDRARVLFEPTPRGIETALRRALTDEDALRPPRASFETGASLSAWAEVLEKRPSPRAAAEAELPAVDVLPQRKLAGASAPFVLFLGNEDEPEPDLLDTLRRAQTVSGADVVSCGLRVRDERGETLHLFHGDPGGLGLLFNGYGTVALIRRSLLGDLTTRWPVENDADWPLLAELAVGGARIVSVPAPLVTRSARPGSLERDPADALLVADRFERALPESLRPLARLAAGLAAGAAQRPAPAIARRRSLRRIIRPRSG
jgi:glycosyltransferase involved in cell wall biosynthesis